MHTQTFNNHRNTDTQTQTKKSNIHLHMHTEPQRQIEIHRHTTCHGKTVDEISRKLASLRYSTGHDRSCSGRKDELEEKTSQVRVR